MTRPIEYAIASAVVLLILLFFIYRLRPRRLRVKDFQKKWEELQKLCASKATWTEAVINADELLDKALKRKRFSGKNPGERRVSAQRKFSNNDGVWFGHKLREKIVSNPNIKLRERDVKAALFGIRQALKDIGALPNDKSKDT